MKSGWIVFALFIVSITLTTAVTITLVSDIGIESEKNIIARFLFERLSTWGFLVFDIGAVLFVYFILTMLRKFDVRAASSFLLTILFLSIFDLTHDIHVLVTGNSIFPLFVFFLLVPISATLFWYLFITNKVPPLKF